MIRYENANKMLLPKLSTGLGCQTLLLLALFLVNFQPFWVSDVLSFKCENYASPLVIEEVNERISAKSLGQYEKHMD